MRAMAIKILVRRKMTVRRMTASAIDMIITEDTQHGKRTLRHYLLLNILLIYNINLWPKASWSKLTEGQPGLLNLQINIEVGGKTNVSYGSRDLFVVIILPVAVPYPCNRNTKPHSLPPTHEEKDCTVCVRDWPAHYCI